VTLAVRDALSEGMGEATDEAARKQMREALFARLYETL
jgi:hypothetical protein